MPIDTELKKALTCAMRDKAYFALVARGSSTGKLIVNTRKISPKAIAEARQEVASHGLGMIGKTLQGICCGGKGGKNLVFEMEQQPPSYMAPLLKRLILQDAGMTVNVETRAAAALFLRVMQGTEPEPPDSWDVR